MCIRDRFHPACPAHLRTEGPSRLIAAVTGGPGATFHGAAPGWSCRVPPGRLQPKAPLSVDFPRFRPHHSLLFDTGLWYHRAGQKSSAGAVFSHSVEAKKAVPPEDRPFLVILSPKWGEESFSPDSQAPGKPGSSPAPQGRRAKPLKGSFAALRMTRGGSAQDDGGKAPRMTEEKRSG